MDSALHTNNRTFQLEAPGGLLSELLGVTEASVLQLGTGTVCSFPRSPGLWQILAPERGSVNVAWSDCAWTLSVPHAAAFPGGEELSLLAAEDCAVRLMILCGTVAERVFTACRQEGGLFFESGGLSVEHAFSLLLPGTAPISPSQSSAVRAAEASSAAYGLLMSLYGTQSGAPEARKHLPLVVEAALGMIRRDYAFLDGIGELAERLEVSQEYLTRSFCRYIGMTPGRYLTRVRIDNARLLLRQGGHSVQFVAEACGFTNANYFARVFRSAVGMNPAEYTRHQPSGKDSSHNEELYVL